MQPVWKCVWSRLETTEIEQSQPRYATLGYISKVLEVHKAKDTLCCDCDSSLGTLMSAFGHSGAGALTNMCIYTSSPSPHN